MFGLLREEEHPEFLEEIGCFILFEQDESLLRASHVGEDGQHFEQELAAGVVIVDPAQQYPWEAAEFGESFRANQT